MNFLDFKGLNVSEITEKITRKPINIVDTNESQCIKDLNEINIQILKLNSENEMLSGKIAQIKDKISALQS